MIATCRECKASFDDAAQWCTCPHPPLMGTDEDRARKDLAITLIGRDLCFAHEPDGPVRRIQWIGWNGMVTLAGMTGEFAPHLFVESAPPKQEKA